MGTVVAGAFDRAEDRLSRADRKRTMVDEVLGDDRLRGYAKRTYFRVEQERGGGRRGPASRKHKRQRR